jgi:secernin
MDLLRLALERADSAAKAVEVIGSLLETYGTGGDPAYRVPYFNANYIIADTKEAYLFESCQRYWAAKKVERTGHLSNCYSLSDDYDIIGKNVVEEVIQKGWAPSAAKINVAAAFTNDDGDYDWAEGYFRYYRQHQLMNNREPFTVKMMMENLRDHYSEEMRNCLPYSVAAAKMPTICCHAGGIGGCVTAASAVCSLNDKVPDPFKFVYWGSMAPPCCSIYRPNFNISWLPEDLQYAGELYDEKSQWWTFIELERYIALNYDLFAPKVREGFDKLENEFIEQADDLQKNYDGNIDKLKKFSMYANSASFTLAKDFLNEIKQKLNQGNIDYLLTDYFKKTAEGCGMKHSLKF